LVDLKHGVYHTQTVSAAALKHLKIENKRTN